MSPITFPSVLVWLTMIGTLQTAQRKTQIGLLISIGAAISFGLYPAAAKAAYAGGANPTTVIIITTFARAVALVVFCLAFGKPILPGRDHLKAVLTGGLCQALSIFGIIASLAYLPAPVTIILMFTHTLMLMLFMGYRGELQLNRSVVFMTVIALLGVSFVVDVWEHTENLNILGISLALLAAVATASRLYVFGKEVLLQHPIVVGAQIFSVASATTLLLCFFSAPTLPQTTLGFWWIAACSASLVVGTFGMFYGIALLGTFQWSLMAKLEPVFTAIFALIIVQEVLSLQQYFGIALVLFSLIGYQLLTQRSKI